MTRLLHTDRRAGVLDEAIRNPGTSETQGLVSFEQRPSCCKQVGLANATARSRADPG